MGTKRKPPVGKTEGKSKRQQKRKAPKDRLGLNHTKVKTRKEIALEIAASGDLVFPMYSMDGDYCTCGDPGCSALNLNPNTGKPVESPGKHPKVRWSTAATTDPNVIEKMFGDNDNIGMPTGDPTNSLVIDYDIKNGVNGLDSLKELEKTLGPLPKTRTNRTGSGGGHLRYSYPTGVRDFRNQTDMISSVDIRANGGCVVREGSIHWSGGTYTVIDDRDPVELPQVWADFIFDQQMKKKSKAVVEDLDVVDFRKDLHDFLYRGPSKYADLWELKGKTSGDTSFTGYAWSLLCSINGSTPTLPHTIPAPTPEDLKAHLAEFVKKHKQGAKRGEEWLNRTVSNFLDEVAEEDDEEEAEDDWDLDDTPSDWEREKTETEARFGRPMVATVREILENEHIWFVEPELLIPGMVYRATTSALIAQPKDGKTTAALSVIADFSRLGRGAPLWFRASTESTEPDLAHLFCSFGGDIDNMTIDQHGCPEFPRFWNLVNELRPPCVVIDTLSSWMLGLDVDDENSSAQTLPYAKFLAELRDEFGCGIFALAHPPKSAPSGSPSIRGSGSLNSAFDLLLGMTSHGLTRTFNPRGRFPLETFTMTYRRTTRRYYYDSDPQNTEAAHDLHTEVCNFVTDDPGHILEEIRKALGRGNNPVREALHDLVKDELVMMVEDGQRHEYFPTNRKGRVGVESGSESGSSRVPPTSPTINESAHSRGRVGLELTTQHPSPTSPTHTYIGESSRGAHGSGVVKKKSKGAFPRPPSGHGPMDVAIREFPGINELGDQADDEDDSLGSPVKLETEGTLLGGVGGNPEDRLSMTEQALKNTFVDD